MIDTIEVRLPESAEQAVAMAHRARCIVGLVARYLNFEPDDVCSTLIGETLFAAEGLLLASAEWRSTPERIQALRKVRP